MPTSEHAEALALALATIDWHEKGHRVGTGELRLARAVVALAAERDAAVQRAERWSLAGADIYAERDAALRMVAERNERIAELERALLAAKADLGTVGITGSRAKANTARARIDAALATAAKGGA